VDQFELIEQFRPAPATWVAEVLARAAAMPDRDDIAEAATERAAAEARAEQRETASMLNRMQGDPIGNVSRAATAVSEARDRVNDLESQLETARGRLTRASESLAHWSGAADEVVATARRSAVTDDPMEQAQRRAHQAFTEHTRELVASRAAGAPRQVRSRRPFVGEVSRSESCQWCIDQNVSDEDSYLLHSDPELAVPVTTPEQAAAAERRRHGSYAEVTR
jgi:hypothetical protein